MSIPVHICGYHLREAGATPEQAIGFAFSNAIAYMQLGIDAGIHIDDLASKIAFETFGGGMEVYREVALLRAARRV